MKAIGFFIVPILFLCCQEKEDITKTNYNLEANQLIQEVIKNQSLSNQCLLEFSENSLIESREEDMPLQAKSMKKTIMRNLEITSEKNLEIQERQSDNFIFDSKILEQNNLELISRETLLSSKNDNSICPRGIVIIYKPIFNTNFTTAVISVDFAFTCLPGMIQTFKLQNGKWISQ